MKKEKEMKKIGSFIKKDKEISVFLNDYSEPKFFLIAAGKEARAFPQSFGDHGYGFHIKAGAELISALGFDANKNLNLLDPIAQECAKIIESWSNKAQYQSQNFKGSAE